MARRDDWSAVLSAAQHEPSCAPLIAMLCMDFGFVDGLKSLVAQGLDMHATVPRSLLRDVELVHSQVSLIDAAVALSRPGARLGDSLDAVFSCLLKAGANFEPQHLNRVIEHDDHLAIRAILSERPEVLSIACKKKLLSCQVFSVEMMAALLDHGFPLKGKVSASRWLWKVEPGTCKQAAALVQHLVNRGLDLDWPDPSRLNNGDKRSKLQYDLSSPALVGKEEVEFLGALIRHGSDLSGLDIANIVSHLPDLAPAFSYRQAQELEASSPHVLTAPRPRRV